MATFGVLVGGGPAPGINGVIGAAALAATRRGARVLGCLHGFKWLMQGDTDHVRELRPEQISRIHLQGGSILHTSRANPTKKPEHLANVVGALDALGVDHLITIGGDDTAFSAKRVADSAEGRIRVVHVPKTIDNDLPLPPGIPTFGFETAREHAATVVENILEDCRTTGRWFFLIVMGRKAGSLALGAGQAAGATIILIPEEFPPGPIRLDDVVRTLEGSVVKRLAQGRPDGVAVIAEGIAERLDPNDLEMLKDVERDAHGHIRLADVPLARVLRHAVRGALAARGVQVAIGEKDVGYELRCGKPSAFDRDYTRALGVGAVQALLEGRRDVLITRQAGRIVPVPFAELMDPATGRTRVRMVDTRSDDFRAARALQDRVERDDLDDAERLGAIAAAAKLAPDQALQRYAPIA
jgi:6-phosphofructokinase 1